MHSQQRAMMVGVAVAALALGGCVQATRHSNAIVFGTNTSFGVTVGPNATSIPAVSIGYNRQEAVFLPLLANTREVAEIVDRNNRQLGAIQPSLSPCNIDPTHVARYAAENEGRSETEALSSREIETYARSSSANPCLFVARRYDGENIQISDAYSVFASFGGTAQGGQGTTPNATVGVGQYFATGVAAQILANNGGGNVSEIHQPGRSSDNDGQDSSGQSGGVPAVPAVPDAPAVLRDDPN